MQLGAVGRQHQPRSTGNIRSSLKIKKQAYSIAAESQIGEEAGGGESAAPVGGAGSGVAPP